MLSVIKKFFSSSDEQEFNYKQFIHKMKKNKQGLMSKKQYMAISEELRQVSPCNLLVFGLGQDSYLWNGINEHGKTIFLEDSKEWIETVNDGSLTVEHVKYTTEVKKHKEIGFDDKELELNLPKEILDLEYDFIIVDAPLGHQPPRPFKGPGRMSSIFMASKLVKENGIVVVDDMGREVERTYSFHYFGENNLKVMIENKVAIFEKVKK